MAGVMVSASSGAMNSLLRKLATIMGEEFSKVKNLRKEVKSISDELRSMNNFLERLSDVDELDKQTSGWRDEVRDMSYDIEDVIDDFKHHIVEKGESSGVVKSTIERLKTLMARHRIANRVKDIKKLVLETSKRHKRYDHHVSPSSDVATDQRIVALYANAADLVGVERASNELVNQLRDEENQLKIVSIVGFGGLGKTTLANEVYRRLKSDFDCSAFVPVSRKPGIRRLLSCLLSQIGIEPSIHACESHLLDKLREHFLDKRYLIIIDDIWDVHAWRVIKCAFPENDLGSRIIATTRIKDVARACCSNRHDHIIEMQPLSDVDSRRLFFNRIFGSEEACPKHFGDVSVQILKKCGGLPLAIVSISSLLASEGPDQKERWENVLNSLGSGTNFTLEGMRQILDLNYRDLPPHLKTCLLYLGMYPEDYMIGRSNLVRQWMAECFISKESGQDVEKAANNYFNELVNRNLIQPVKFDKQGSVTQCRIHDMMLDLILRKSADGNFFTIVDDPQAITRLNYKACRLSIRLDGSSDGQTMLPRNTDISQVWFVMFFGKSDKAPPLSEFKFLRFLYIDLDHAIVDFTGLRKLYLLRYLWISNLCLYQLPTQIRMLQQLETLDVLGCKNLPSDIVHLPRLMHLNVKTGLLDGIGNMKSLEHLCAFDFAMNTLDNIKGLGELTNLKYLILDFFLPLEDAERRMDALCSSLGKLYSLEDLLVRLTGCIDDLMPMSPPATPYRLERLFVLPSCWFSRVPGWMCELRYLGTLQCRLVNLLNDGVGILADLPALIRLDIKTQKATNEMVVISGRGAFPTLKCFKLLLRSTSYLTFQAGAMPQLQRLELMFNSKGSEQNGFAPAGIEHLLALKELCAGIGRAGDQEYDKTSIESDFRSAITMHPSHPRVGIIFLGNYHFYCEV